MKTQEVFSYSLWLYLFIFIFIILRKGKYFSRFHMLLRFESHIASSYSNENHDLG